MDILRIIRRIEDPRRDHSKEHSLECIFYIALAAVISGAESWYEVEDFGRLKHDFFCSRISDFRGVPSHDTFNRVFSLLEPKVLEKSFRSWMDEICGKYKGIVAIDGKTLKGSAYRNSKGSFSALHMVSAWAAENGVVMGQERIESKSNEITAIPALIQALDLKDCIVTIDAMGCQKNIVKTIVEKEADYLICLKKNQGKFYSTLESWFEDFDRKHIPQIRYDTYISEEQGHGRREKRICQVYSNGVLDKVFQGWEKLTSVVRLHSFREEIVTGKKSEQIRYYITSLGLDAEKIAKAIREHWSIENQLHWQLDVTFREDSARKRKNAAQNFSLLNKIALMAVKKNTRKGSLKAKRKMAGWDEKFMRELLENKWK